MPYDTDLAERIRAALADTSGVSEKKMFGGLAFLVDGRMAVAASGRGGLMVRVDPGDAASLLATGVEPMVMRGRELAGWLHVDPAACRATALARWVERGVATVRALST